MELFEGGGDLSIQFLQPGAIVHHGQVEHVARSNSRNTILYAIHSRIGPVHAVLEFIDSSADIRGVSPQDIHVKLSQHALIHIANELAGVLQADNIGHVVAHDVGVEHFVEVGVVNGQHVDVHIERILNVLDDYGVLSRRRGVVGRPGDRQLFLAGPVGTFRFGHGRHGNHSQQQAQSSYQGNDSTHGISSFF